MTAAQLPIPGAAGEQAPTETQRLTCDACHQPTDEPHTGGGTAMCTVLCATCAAKVHTEAPEMAAGVRRLTAQEIADLQREEQ